MIGVLMDRPTIAVSDERGGILTVADLVDGVARD